MQTMYKLLISSCLFLSLEQTVQAKRTELVEEIVITKAPQENGKIKLFVYKNCPFCHKVINYIEKNGLNNKVVILEATENMAELKRLNNGDTQCPFLVDEPKNIQMLESADIIKYLSTRFN